VNREGRTRTIDFRRQHNRKGAIVKLKLHLCCVIVDVVNNHKERYRAAEWTKYLDGPALDPRQRLATSMGVLAPQV
jgi:hypothetical protein